MMSRNGFNFVELLLVMMVLGVIMALTMPILTNLKDDDDFYRAYMKKANQDVMDMVSMTLVRNRMIGLTGFNKLGHLRLTGVPTTSSQKNSTYLRKIFSTGIRGEACDGAACLSSMDFAAVSGDAITPSTNAKGLKLPGKAVIIFEYGYKAANGTQPAYYGHIYYDINGDKRPNKLCQDRYKFRLFKDSAEMLVCSMSIDKDKRDEREEYIKELYNRQQKLLK